MKKQRIIYYEDELNDEFSETKIKPRIIDENYNYFHNKIWNLFSIFFQNILSMPIKILYSKIKFKIKYIGKEKLKKYKKEGYFIYANHTQIFADTFIPSIPVYPKRNFFIVNPENISIKPFGGLIQMLGAVPVPGDKEATKKFLKIIEKRVVTENSSITIYPEAHIWPYYTKIRPFKSVSFKYPVKLEKPAFCITNTYKSYGKKNNKIKIISYIDGPFYANKELPIKERTQELRNKIYNCMTERSKNSDIEKIKYVKKQENIKI